MELLNSFGLHEIHGSTSSSGGPEDSNHEEEEAPTATSIKTLSCMRLGKHKS